MWRSEREWMEPIEAAERLADLQGVSVLDSAMTQPTLGRYSILAADPFGIFHVENGIAFWNEEKLPDDPLAALRKRLALYPNEASNALPCFSGGAIGAISYEFGWALDHGPMGARVPLGRTVHFGFYDMVIAFDHAERRCWLLSTGWPETTGEGRKRRARDRIAYFSARLETPARERGAPVPRLDWRPDVSRAVYKAGIEHVKDAIRAGDIYQANIAQGYSAELPPGTDGFQLYKRLRATNPAPFAAYLRCGETTILSSSPERLVRKRGQAVETRPIKGTAPRGQDAASDAALGQALVHSAKDRAENVMIVDLLRNDLSKVCAAQSVAVPVLCGLETYEGLHHLVSVVTGELRDGLDALDLIRAIFPGGSITGAPKLRAMEIIAAIEREPRGIYCGAIGMIGFDGDIDLNIAIRTLVIEQNRATFKTGGGITILSDPDVEYEETLIKARRIFAAFATADARA